MTTNDDDYGRKYGDAYVRGRRLRSDAAEAWARAVGEWVPAGAGWTIVDVGSGTGRFSGLLAERLGARVIGVEPSESMRRQAPAGPGLARVAGRAEALPLADATCDAAWLSMVIHHFADLPAACREVRRVLRPGGLALVRSALRASLAAIRMYEFFPSARRYDESRIPSLEETVGAFTEAGLGFVAHRVVTQRLDDSLLAHAERIRMRAISSLERVGPEEWAEGLRRMEAAARGPGEPAPVVEPIDLAVFRKGGR